MLGLLNGWAGGCHISMLLEGGGVMDWLVFFIPGAPFTGGQNQDIEVGVRIYLLLRLSDFGCV